LRTKTGISEEKLRTFSAIAFLAAVPVALFFPALFLDKLINGADALALAIPFHAEVQRSLAAHQWPLWMPDVLGGMPGIASCNLLFIYPTDFVACLSGLPLPAMLGLDAAAHVALAGIGMFLFLRRLRRTYPASVLGAFFFALSGSQISQLNGGFYNFVEGIAWVPWVFWAAYGGFEKKSWSAWALCGLFFSLQILAGASQLFTYTAAAAASFILAEAWNRPKAAAPATEKLAACMPVLLGLGLALGAAFLLAAPQLWPTLGYLPLAARQDYTHAQFAAGSFGPSAALNWAVPAWPTLYEGSLFTCFTSEYFGLLPWTLAAGALLALGRSEAKVRWMAVLAFGAFFLSQGWWTPFYALFHGLPVVSGFRIWSRILFLLTFAVCVMAAYGWDALHGLKTRAAARGGAWAFLGLALAAAALAWILAPCQNTVPAGVVRGSAERAPELVAALLALLYFWDGRLNMGAALVLALAFHAVDQKGPLARSVHFVDPETAVAWPRFLRPPPPRAGLEPWRIYDYSDTEPNSAVLLGYENLQGYESVPLRSYRDLGDAMRDHTGDWLSLMNVRYIFERSKPTPQLPGGALAIYENRGAFPRAWLVGRSRKVSGQDAAYRLLSDTGFHPRDEVALSVDASLAGSSPRGAVHWLGRSPQAFSLAVTTDRPAALVLSNFWYPSWKATVDGREAPVLQADGALQAVLLNAGNHSVDFRFDPSLFYGALAACLAGLAALLGLCRSGAQARKRFSRICPFCATIGRPRAARRLAPGFYGRVRDRRCGPGCRNPSIVP